MKLVLLILSIISLGTPAAFGQPSTVIGSIDRITASDITVKTPRGSFTIYAGNRTEVLKDKTFRDFSPLKVGDEISARRTSRSSRSLLAVDARSTGRSGRSGGPIGSVGSVRTIRTVGTDHHRSFLDPDLPYERARSAAAGDAGATGDARPRGAGARRAGSGQRIEECLCRGMGWNDECG